MRVFLFLALALAVDSKSYEGYKVFRTSANTEDHKQVLIQMANGNKYDFWSSIRNTRPVDIMVSPQDQDTFLGILRDAGMGVSVFVENVQSLLDKEMANRTDEMSWNNYQTLETIYGWLDEMVTAHSDKASVIIGGKTYQNRSIKGLKISFKPGKQIVFIEGGIHAREWIAPATVTYLINEILTSTDPAFRRVAESFEWHIFPVVNPDGYVYSHTNDRFWRKNMKPGYPCNGTDLNRNFNQRWGEYASNDTCSDTFAGTAPFSEIESYSFADYIRSVASRMVAFLGFHSPSQLLLLPYGYTVEHLENYNDMMKICKKSVEHLVKRYNTIYEVGSIAEILYPSSGTSIEWVKQEFKTPIVAVYELRPPMILPTEQIIPNCLEIMDAIVGMMEEAEKFGYVTLV